MQDEPPHYRVEIDWAPAYELTLSLAAYATRPDDRLLDLGSTWLKKVDAMLDPDLAAELTREDDTVDTNLVDLLIWMCPGSRDVDAFLAWFARLTSGDIYDRLAPCWPDHLPKKLTTFRDQSVEQLSKWNDQYFRHIDPAILEGLEADDEVHRMLASNMEPVELVEHATNGIWFTPEGGIDLVLLVPQYHHRPWNVYSYYRQMRLYRYPADVEPVADGAPPPSLLRLARTLADESRLRILRHIGREERSFTELVELTGLAKSTVYHHMVALRAAGLVRVNDTDEKVMTYSLRPAAEDRVAAALSAYLRPA